MIHYQLLLNRQGKTRLSKFYSFFSQKERNKIPNEIANIVLFRKPKECNFLEWRDFKIVYRRYASLYFVFCIDKLDNELLCLEMMHFFCVVLDRYFGNVCELDIVYNFDKVYQILDELFIAGELQETSIQGVLKCLAGQDEQIVVEVMEEAMLLT